MPRTLDHRDDVAGRSERISLKDQSHCRQSVVLGNRRLRVKRSRYRPPHTAALQVKAHAIVGSIAVAPKRTRSRQNYTGKAPKRAPRSLCRLLQRGILDRPEKDRHSYSHEDADLPPLAKFDLPNDPPTCCLSARPAAHLASASQKAFASVTKPMLVATL